MRSLDSSLSVPRGQGDRRRDGVGGDPQVRTLDSSLSVLRGYGGGQEKGGIGWGPSASKII